jgi:RND family efflux transporter MFP subunit
MNPGQTEHKKSSKTRLILVIVVLVIIAIAGIVIRMHEASALHDTTEENAIPAVVVMKVTQGTGSEETVLPGSVQAWHEAPIYARTSGYLKDWKTDIGTPVKAGDLIAEIDTPEVDAQLHQAEADLGTAEANQKLAQSTADRWIALLKTNAVSKQDADEKISAASAGTATVAAAQANVDRLKQLEIFKTVTAPFDGTITARNTDVGALINAGSNGTGPELFHIAETDKLRIYVQMPQPYVPQISQDLTADLTFSEHPGKTYPAKLSRTADAIDPTARTLLVEFEVDNDTHELLPGGYTDVHLKFKTAESTVRLPVNTLLFRAEGLQVAVVDDQSKVSLKTVKVSRDFGNTVEVQSGIDPGAQIVVNPPDSLADGEKVRIVPAEKKDAGDDKAAKGDNKDKNSDKK